MLEPREADIPGLFLILVVLPLVTYILLGKWSEASKKKARINMLAQLAAEEAQNVEVMASVDVVPVAVGPSFNLISHVCARCFSPATTRCSRCKSVRYCSGKCQIIHWRQGHKQECQQWENERSIFSAAVSSMVGASQCATSIDVNLKSTSFENERLPEVKTDDDMDSCLEEASSNCITSSPCLKSRSTELRPTEAHRNHKLGNDSFASSENTSSKRNNSLFIHCRGHSDGRNALRETHNSGAHERSSSVSYKSVFTTSQCSGKIAINDYKKDAEYHSEQVKTPYQEVYCSEETLEFTSAVDKSSAKAGMNFRKPPYTADSNFSLRKSALKPSREQPISGNEKKACIEKESRIHQLATSITPSGHDINGLSNMGNNKALSPKMTPKLPKHSASVNTSDTLGKNKMLFQYEDLVKLFQCEVCVVSPRGLSNCGNSCYANAVLQCLTCTKPLLVYLLRGIHSKYCYVKDWCLFCELELHASKLRESGGPLSASRILSNMRNIGCRMGGGNQEDAHEFLRLLVMSMQAICLEGLGGEKEVDPRLQETTLIQQIFGGCIKSKVKCLRCQHESERYENIMDLTLEIHGWVESLEDALTQFTASEELDGDNLYRCGRCSAYVKARKQLSVHEAPNILTIVLKRFQTGKYGKINKCVSFPDLLDMIPFMTGTGDSPPLYMLYGVVVHLDTFNASFSGHYVAYVKDLQGDWFRVDDTEVQAVTLSQVMSEGAYMLFYSRSFPRPPRVHSHSMKQNPNQSKHSASKVSKPPRCDTAKLAGVASSSYGLPNASRSTILKKGCLSGSGGMDFYETSDCSLFTSSDDSSFTTESTSDSFSTIDHTDAANLDPISSLFSPVCIPEYSQKSTISCRNFSCCRPQTRFFSESEGFVRDSSTSTQPLGCVHKAKNQMLLYPGNFCFAPAKSPE